MTQTYTENVIVDGTEDKVQLTVQGHSTQTQPLQEWQDSAGNALAQVSEDGRVQVGDSMSTPDALIEAHRDETSPLPQRGLHSLGKIANVITTAIAWVVSELELVGTNAISSIHAAVRGRLTHSSTGDSSTAELRAGDFEVVNQSGTSATPVGGAVGLQGTVDNQQNAHLTKASGVVAQIQNATGADIETATAIEVGVPVNDGTIDTLIGVDIPDITQGTENYALRTGAGLVHLGDIVEVEPVSSAPSAKVGVTQLYSKPDGKLYAKDPADNEYDLTHSGGGGSVSVMTGATDSVDGAEGLVPQPLAGDEVKFLKGDGTWATVIGGSGTHSHTLSDITDNGDLAYQNSDSIYASGGYFTGIHADLTNLTVIGDNWVLNDTKVVSNIAVPESRFYRARGTLSTPTAIQTGDVISEQYACGYDGTNYVMGSSVATLAEGNWSSTTRDASLVFKVSEGTEQYGHVAMQIEKDNALYLHNASVAPIAGASGSKIWSENGELRVMDFAGNITTLSSHNPQLVDPTGRPTSYVHAERNPFTGKYIEIDTYRVAQLLEQLTGETLIHVQDLPGDERADWDANEVKQNTKREIERQRWEELPEEKRNAIKPETYTPRLEPAFLRSARNWGNTKKL